jgi:segregation and condensation protein B
MVSTPGQEPETSPQPGLSLRELSQAFAQAMSTPAAAEAEGTLPAIDLPDPGIAPDQRPAPCPADEPPPPPEDLATGDGLAQISPRTILEAMLFVGNRSNEPLTAAGAAGLMRGVEPGEIAALIDELNDRYAANRCPYRIVNEGPGYRIRLGSAFAPLRNKFYGRIREARLSQAAIDVLAIIAYQQPLSAEDVSRLRGKPSGHLLSQLVRRQLLRAERPQVGPRKLRYLTTDRFLQLFGLDSLDDLPRSEALERR